MRVTTGGRDARFPLVEARDSRFISVGNGKEKGNLISPESFPSKFLPNEDPRGSPSSLLQTLCEYSRKR